MEPKGNKGAADGKVHFFLECDLCYGRKISDKFAFLGGLKPAEARRGRLHERRGLPPALAGPGLARFILNRQVSTGELKPAAG